MSEAPDAGHLALDAYTEVRRADVYKGGHLAAHLTRVPTGIEFAYTDEWLTHGGDPGR